MYQTTCHYCQTTLYLFQVHTAEATSYTVDMTPVTDEINICYWCALKEEPGETNGT